MRSTLLDRLTSGAVSLKGKVGEVDPPHLVLPLTVEPTKPRLCHVARFLNLWMRDMPFKLDTLLDLPRYVAVMPIKQYLMTSRGMTISSFPWKVEPFLVCSGVGGTLFTTSCLFAGRYLLLYTTPLVQWHLISSDQWGYLVHCTSMTGTTSDPAQPRSLCEPCRSR